ncbi:MAG: UDP-glucose:(heptosyl)LPS alpha-1 3-glucosyltransferase [Rhodocyclaceae bacterium]|nr:MAG: UDP-glucose:(heptosyl)LPS alpha-1 3-glucosyltransferase [Rhodocyclaceae bacterium]TND01526.1 MAG: UDP-glucose:(heptosyl)LPS alpha-1,3-glucosyltransferase [Rhodocyclaceae bacterium]
MKLAIVRQKYTPFGGAERFVERALAALRANHVDVSIVAREWQDDVAGDMPCVRVNPFYLGRTWRDAGFSRGVQRLLAQRRFDLVQSHERIPGCDIYRAGDGVHATWLELRNKPSDAYSPWHRYTIAAEAEMFRHPKLRTVICNSRMVRDDIARRFGLAGEKLQVIYSGVDLDAFHPRLREEQGLALREKTGVGETAPVLLFVGSGYQRKGVPTLLRALSQMKRNDARLWVVGRDKDEMLMRKLAQTLGVDERVLFLGAQTDVKPFYGAADVFALPTIYDPFPNAALEALACGLPLVTTTTCGAAELVTADNGLVISAGDDAALAAGLDALCGRAPAMRDAARASVAHLALAQMAAQLMGLYSRLV